MKNLSRVYIFKISATLLFWCFPLILFPKQLLLSVGFPEQTTYLFVRMLGWAYLALCVGYFVGLIASLNGEKLMVPIYVGLVSNGGACLYLFYYGLNGEWSSWGFVVQLIAWSSILATFLITFGLYIFGIKGAGARENE